VIVLQAFAANGYVPTLTFTPLHPQTALFHTHHRSAHWWMLQFD